MSTFVFPDNTVLCNFAAGDSLYLLKRVLDGAGRWTEAVAREARRSSHYWPALQSLPGAGWLGEPIIIDEPEDILEVERIRRFVLGSDQRKPRKNLGEAQTLHVIMNWAQFAGAWWISDDRASVNLARRKGIPSFGTKELMIRAVDAALLDLDAAFDLLQLINSRRNCLRLPDSPAALRM